MAVPASRSKVKLVALPQSLNSFVASGAAVAGVKVFVRGSLSLRVYSSQKDRCMKAGAQISAQEIELCGGSSDDVPRQLIIPDSGALVPVRKYYQADVDTKDWKKDDQGYLVDAKGNQYSLVKGGWVAPIVAQEGGDNA